MSEDEPASEQFDLSLGQSFDLEPEDLRAVAATLEQAEAFDVENASDALLADFVAALKRIENAAEDARKDVFEDELDERVETGESIGDLVKQSGTNSWVADDEGALAAVAEAGEDPLDVASVSIGDLRDVLGPKADEYLGESSYTYYRRQG